MAAEVNQAEFNQLRQSVSDMLALISTLRLENMQLSNRVGLLEDSDDLPWPKPDPNSGVSPLTSVKLESGAAVTITNTYDAAVRRYLWVDIENLTGEWKLNTQASFPDKVIIYDGSAGYGSELIITGH